MFYFLISAVKGIGERGDKSISVGFDRVPAAKGQGIYSGTGSRFGGPAALTRGRVGFRRDDGDGRGHGLVDVPHRRRVRLEVDGQAAGEGHQGEGVDHQLDESELGPSSGEVVGRGTADVPDDLRRRSVRSVTAVSARLRGSGATYVPCAGESCSIR